jgi:hypothetical protein
MRFKLASMAGNVAGINLRKALSMLLSLNPRALIEKGSQIICHLLWKSKGNVQGVFKILFFWDEQQTCWRNNKVHYGRIFCTLKMEAVDFLEMFLFLNEFLHYP